MKNYKVTFSCSKLEQLGGNWGQNFLSLIVSLAGTSLVDGAVQGVLHVVNSPETDTEVKV